MKTRKNAQAAPIATPAATTAASIAAPSSDLPTDPPALSSTAPPAAPDSRFVAKAEYDALERKHCLACLALHEIQGVLTLANHFALEADARRFLENEKRLPAGEGCPTEREELDGFRATISLCLSRVREIGGLL